MRRPNTVKVDAAPVQGEGAYVEWVRLTWGERRAALSRLADLDGQALKDFTEAFLFEHLAGWNWVDTHGDPLPLPRTSDDLLPLYEEEAAFLYDVAARAIRGQLEITADDLKN